MNRLVARSLVALPFLLLIALVAFFQNCSAPLTDNVDDYASTAGSSSTIQISSYPTGLQLATGQSTYLTVSAYSTQALPLSYQWYKDAVALSGATANSLYIASASAIDQGSYFLKISDGTTNVSTPAFYVQVGTGSTISISSGPSAQTVAPGAITRFEVVASDSTGRSLTFQWLKNGVAISDQVGSEMYIQSTVLGDAGYYAVVISNGVSSVKSGTVYLSVQATTASCAALGGSLYNTHCYVVNRTSATWANAQATCQSAGGTLAVISSSGENYFIYSITQTSVWIGLSDQTTEGSFIWSDGTALSFSVWGTGEPSASTTAEDCVEMTAYGSWNDNACSGKRPFVCEI